MLAVSSEGPDGTRPRPPASDVELLSSSRGAAATGSTGGSSSSLKDHDTYHGPHVNSTTSKPLVASAGSESGVTSAGLAVLVLLAAQNCAKNLVMRAAVRGHASFLYSAAVIGSESCKCALALGYVLATGGTAFGVASHLRAEWRKMVLLTVPAAIYNAQQTLEYVALANLDAAVFSVIVQTKLLSTALFAAGLMGRQLRKAQVISLVLLTTGVMLASDASSSASSEKAGGTQSSRPQKSRFVGVAATLGIALCSGFASVYTEKVIKAAGTGAKARNNNASPSGLALHHAPSSGGASSSSSAAVPSGLAYTQIQLALTSILILVPWAAAKDYESIRDFGLWHGFDKYAMIAVLNSAIGGLTVAAVLRFADAILKGYATAVSVMLTGVLSSFIFGTQLNTEYALGSANVVIAVLLYNSKDLDTFAW